MSIAAAALFECVPTSSLAKPRSLGPMKSTAALMRMSISLDVILLNLVPSWNVETGHSSEYFG